MTREEAIKNIKEQMDLYVWQLEDINKVVEPRRYEQYRLAIMSFEMAIKALEQQPQTDEIILSKKEYRELLSDEFEHGYDKGLSDAITSLEQEPCNDAISRQAAIDCLNADFTIDGKENMETVVDYINGAFKQIKALPSVTPQPKTGHWIEKYAEDACGERYSYWACSECGRSVGFNLANIKDVLSDYPYCHCGAKMVEPQERSGEE